MTLEQLRPVAARALRPFVMVSVRTGMTPDTISTAAFVMAIGAGISFYVGGVWYLAGAVLVFLNGWLDLLDGAVARELGIEDEAGDMLDHVLDRYADIIIIGGLAAGIEAYAIGFVAVTGVLMTSYLGTQAMAVGLERMYAGVLGRADRLVLIGVVAALAPFSPLIGPLSIVGWLLVVFAVVGHLTAAQRFWQARNAL